MEKYKIDLSKKLVVIVDLKIDDTAINRYQEFNKLFTSIGGVKVTEKIYMFNPQKINIECIEKQTTVLFCEGDKLIALNTDNSQKGYIFFEGSSICKAVKVQQEF